jgi:hypothetical protein
MRTTYRYKKLSYAVADDKEVYYAIKFVSDGDYSQTIINIPGDNDPEIKNSGMVLLGKGKDLRGETTVSFTDDINPIPEEDEIKIRYFIGEKSFCEKLINGQLTDEQLHDATFLDGQIFVEHSNLKKDEERPYIVLFINFT